jgi:hypothetical protein
MKIIIAAGAAVITAIIMTSFIIFAPATATAVEDHLAIITRVIKIEGSVEKPRVIFIVPKARLWRAHIIDKDFTEELLRPIRPDR